MSDYPSAEASDAADLLIEPGEGWTNAGQRLEAARVIDRMFVDVRREQRALRWLCQQFADCKWADSGAVIAALRPNDGDKYVDPELLRTILWQRAERETQ